MNKSILTTGLLGVVLALLFGCASAPGIKSPDDCLVVIKTDFVVNPQLTQEEQSGRFYQLKLDGDYPLLTLRGEYSLVVVREPAAHVTSIVTGPQPPYQGPTSYQKVDITLPYKPGYIVVADFVFEKKTEKTSAYHFMTYTSFRKITDKEREGLLERFRNDSAFKAWKK